MHSTLDFYLLEMCFQMFRGRGDTSPRFLASSQTLQPKRRRWRRSEPAAFKLDEAVFPPQDRCKTTPLIVSLCGGASQRNNQHSAINQHGVCVFDGCRAACRLNGWSTTSSAPGPDNIQPVEEGRGRGGRLGMGGGLVGAAVGFANTSKLFFSTLTTVQKKIWL